MASPAAPPVRAGLTASAACSPPAPGAAGDEKRGGAQQAAADVWHVPFTVRGRLHDPSSVRVRLDARGGPLDDATLRDAFTAAAAGWNASGLVGLHEAGADEAPDVVVGWRRAADDPCRLFGRARSVAHTGPMEPGTFVHLDAGRAWSADAGEPGASLAVALAHELGHVLGLDHSPDPSALMHTDARVTAPARADLLGLHTLYGGGEEGPGDVLVQAAGGRPVAPPLRGVAPPRCTALALFDADGDGRDELLVWRTDVPGAGGLTVYHFERGGTGAAAGPRLVRAVGPLLDLVPPGARTSLRTSADGRRWLVTREGESERVRLFDGQGWLAEPSTAELRALDLPALLRLPAPAVLAGEGDHGTDGPALDALAGDLDGDGVREVVRRAPPARPDAAAAPTGTRPPTERRAR